MPLFRTGKRGRKRVSAEKRKYVSTSVKKTEWGERVLEEEEVFSVFYDSAGGREGGSWCSGHETGRRRVTRAIMHGGGGNFASKRGEEGIIF